MRVGNMRYRSFKELPERIPVMPLRGALLLPSGQLPLNIFEPRYLTMLDDVLAGDRVVGIIQPELLSEVDDEEAQRALELDEKHRPNLSAIGCLGRVTTFAETGDGRVLITLQGITRFRVVEEIVAPTAYRQCRILPFMSDFNEEQGGDDVDREGLLRAFRAYLEVSNLEADWDNIARANNVTLVNALSMMSPFGPAEKQALLEAADLKLRAETLIAITEVYLAREKDDYDSRLQ